MSLLNNLRTKSTVLAPAIVLAACTTTGQVTSTVTPTTVCQAVANVAANLRAQAVIQPQVAANTAAGQVWQYAASGCIGNQPAAGVNASWTQEMLSLAKTALPIIVPLVATAL